MQLNYRQYGEGQAFVILHGLFGSLDNWQTHAKKLADYFQVTLVDQRNHGHSPWSDQFSYDLLANDLKKLTEQLGISKMILLGHSMGGKTAIRFAQLYPELIEKLIIVDIGMKEYPMHHTEILQGMHSVDLQNIHSRSEAENSLIHYISSAEVRQFLLKNLYWKEKGELAWRMNIAVLEQEMPNILAALPNEEILLPTLFIRGSHSNYILDEDIDELEVQFPDMQLQTIANTGHWVHAEKPEEFIESVLRFCLL